ncbi:putative Transcriptional regulator, LysR family [Vibrio nigripulchritudo SOn1]|uniref:Transcriptional regulator, LysR family n=1 Tax=Vibrio nigripulchritudo SOn1 TaxID=1238450 RepID=A0AAV2VPW1_9VIBR|nr:LysR substrate-binding domain-containing protein [Vibrio nigripulchritudo]CCO46766.1 putative Transcriptional regulator, LysR family [Vibrio nigripulchritudo SOn1]
MDISQKILSRIKLKQLQLVVAVDDMRTLKGASDSICMSQPAVTQSLKELESALGCQLFSRTNRGVVPTVFGEALIKHARTIITQMRHAGEELSDLMTGSGGKVVVGTLLASSALILPQTIIKLRETRPKLNIKVIDGTNDILMPRLLRGDIDLVIGRLPEHEYREGTQQIFLYNEEIIVFTSPSNPLAGYGRVSLKDLSEHEWVLPPTETTLRKQLEKAFFDAGLASPTCAVESTSWLTNKYLWMNSDLIGVAPAHTVKEKIRRGELAQLPIRLSEKLGPVGISIHNGGELSSVVKIFIDCLKNVSREYSDSVS